MYKLVLSVLVMLLISSHSVAGTCDAKVCQAKVKKLYPHENGNVYVQADADMSTLNCTLNQGLFMVLESSNARHSEIYSMLLSAYMADKEVTMRAAEGSSNCRLMYTQLRL